MSLKSYGVLSAGMVDTRREGDAETPHYQIHLADGDGTHWRAAVNVKSQEKPSALKYVVVDDFRHPITALLPAGGSGWTDLPARPGGPNLDFVRGNLFDPSTMRVLPPEMSGPDNDLADLLDHYIQRAVGDSDITAYVFGQRWGPENGTPDKVFGFDPGNGVHDVHMNQGNSGSFRRDDGIWQDGGLLLHLSAESRWIAAFLAFQNQSWHTDDHTGHTLTGAPALPRRGRERARIVAAHLPLASQAAGAGSAVTLINASPDTLDLTGWRITDRATNTCTVGVDKLPAGATCHVPLTDGVTLGADGGVISLLDPDGLKVHGVAYTAEQAHDDGWSIVF